jgi:hypothetical protein
MKDFNKIAEILRKLIIFIKVCANIALIIACYLVFIAITKKDIRMFLFAVGGFAYFIICIKILEFLEGR